MITTVPANATVVQYSHRNRQYHAEHLARQKMPLPPLDGTQKAAQAYVDRITRSAWWRRTCPPSWMGDNRDKLGHIFDDSQPPQRIIVNRTRGRGGWAYAHLIPHRGKLFPEIRLGGHELEPGQPPAIANPWVLLHEVAHIMAMSADHQGHGREFARYFMLLVRRWLGPDAARALREAYAAAGVRYRGR